MPLIDAVWKNTNVFEYFGALEEPEPREVFFSRFDRFSGPMCRSLMSKGKILYMFRIFIVLVHIFRYGEGLEALHSVGD